MFKHWGKWTNKQNNLSSLLVGKVCLILLHDSQGTAGAVLVASNFLVIWCFQEEREELVAEWFLWQLPGLNFRMNVKWKCQWMTLIRTCLCDTSLPQTNLVMPCSTTVHKLFLKEQSIPEGPGLLFAHLGLFTFPAALGAFAAVPITAVIGAVFSGYWYLNKQTKSLVLIADVFAIWLPAACLYRCHGWYSPAFQ